MMRELYLETDSYHEYIGSRYTSEEEIPKTAAAVEVSVVADLKRSNPRIHKVTDPPSSDESMSDPRFSDEEMFYPEATIYCDPRLPDGSIYGPNFDSYMGT
ncbi:predicted protein [Arabidopsis lyrata subsp. lyrata]|uniref:Predicted protein n=1 Tax=Arabidopsis lyrata subsp. lyrata TaxID=81972 RepID=D7M9Y9_ARALL|nr:predicted protein [Arabidopsis lyrata subsp. lyrata]